MSWQEKVENSNFHFTTGEILSKHLGMGVGGPARFFINVSEIKTLIALVEFLRSAGAPYKVIGGGTNIIASDEGFGGVIIKNRTSSLNIDVNTGRVIADSGVPLSHMIMEAATSGLGGLEPLYGVPGTVGGAIVNNAGAHGVAISDFLKSAAVITSVDKIENHAGTWFGFGYRESKLKYKKEDFPPVILSAIFQFQRKKSEDLMMDLAKWKNWRAEKQPLGAMTSGSIFRNPSGNDNAQNEDERFKSAGYLLEQAGAKRVSVGGARVSKKHANWIENASGATSSDVRKLIDQMRNAVLQKYQITLNEEIEYIGKWDGV